MAEPIEQQSPASGEAINLSEVELRWSSLPDAEFYQLQLSVGEETPRPRSLTFLTLDV